MRRPDEAETLERASEALSQFGLALEHFDLKPDAPSIRKRCVPDSFEKVGIGLTRDTRTDTVDPIDEMPGKRPTVPNADADRSLRTLIAVNNEERRVLVADSLQPLGTPGKRQHEPCVLELLLGGISSWAESNHVSQPALTDVVARQWSRHRERRDRAHWHSRGS